MTVKIIVDPCWLPHEVEGIKQYVEKVKENRPLYCYLHIQIMTILSAARLFQMQKSLQVPTLITRVLRQGAIIEEIKAFDDEYYITRNYKIIYPEVDLPISGEETSIKLGETKLIFFQATGHNDDGIFTLIEPLAI